MSYFDYIVKAKDGTDVSLTQYAGKVLLIVNTATGCGFTPQYDDLERIYAAYRDKGFEVLDFPCNQFGKQAPGTNEEIAQFCTLKYNVSFPQFSKIEVNGPHEDPLYTYLKSQQKGLLGSAIKWNFTKFLVNRDGNVVARFAPTETPEKLEDKIKELL